MAQDIDIGMSVLCQSSGKCRHIHKQERRWDGAIQACVEAQRAGERCRSVLGNSQKMSAIQELEEGM